MSFYFDEEGVLKEVDVCDCCVQGPLEVLLSDQGPPEVLLFDGSVMLGSHLKFERSLAETFQTALKYGMYVFQFYLGASVQYRRASLTKKDVEAVRALLSKYPCQIFTHTPTILNLAGSVKMGKLAWTGDEGVDDLMEKQIQVLNHELKVLNSFGGKGAVVHPGCYLRGDKSKTQAQIEQEAINAIAATLSRVTFEGEAKVLLENCAGEKGKVAYNLEQLARIRDGVSEENRSHIAWCVDTCHIFAAGVYDLSECAEVVRMFDDFEKYRERGRVELIHLNDSDYPFGGRVDRHAALGTGHIWSKGWESLRLLLNLAGERKIPLVLETSSRDMLTLHHVLSLTM